MYTFTLAFISTLSLSVHAASISDPISQIVTREQHNRQFHNADFVSEPPAKVYHRQANAPVPAAPVAPVPLAATPPSVTKPHPADSQVRVKLNAMFKKPKNVAREPAFAPGSQAFAAAVPGFPGFPVAAVPAAVPAAAFPAAAPGFPGFPAAVPGFPGFPAAAVPAALPAAAPAPAVPAAAPAAAAVPAAAPAAAPAAVPAAAAAVPAAVPAAAADPAAAFPAALFAPVAHVPKIKLGAGAKLKIKDTKHLPEKGNTHQPKQHVNGLADNAAVNAQPHVAAPPTEDDPREKSLMNTFLAGLDLKLVSPSGKTKNEGAHQVTHERAIKRQIDFDRLRTLLPSPPLGILNTLQGREDSMDFAEYEADESEDFEERF